MLLTALVVLPHVLHAQTLDELKHPLIDKGKAVVSADYDTYAIEHGAADIEYGDLTFFEPRYVVMPSISFGLARGLQARVSGAYEFPTVFSYTMFEAWDYTRERTQVRSLSGELTYRPRSNFEVGGMYLFGRSDWTSEYARSRAANAQATDGFRSSVVSFYGTWLPSAQLMSPVVRADLDGLQHPLLKRRRSRIEWEVMARTYNHDFHDSDDVSPAFVREHIASNDVRVRFGGAHGITDSIQLAADAYVHAPFTMTQTTESRWESDPAAVPRTYSTAQRFQGVLGVLLDGRWRPAARAEAFATGTWEQQSISISTPQPQPTANYRTTTCMVGGTVLSRTPRKSYTLAADVRGLYHPLVEPKQVKIDVFAYYFAFREPGDYFDLDVRVYRLQATTGLTSWLQASAYGGALLSKHYMSDGRFERHGSFGGELKLRVKNGTELYGTLEQHRAGFVGRYPMFVVATGEDLGSFDVLHPDFEGKYTAHIGARFVF